jgi:hypothetical protein
MRIILLNIINSFLERSRKVCRCLDQFVEGVAAQNVNNKNIELRGKNGFKLFPNGISHILRNGISVDGAFHISMARHLATCVPMYIGRFTNNDETKNWKSV